MDIRIFLLFFLAALLVAWVVNAIVNVLSGEKRNDTGSLWIDDRSADFCSQGLWNYSPHPKLSGDARLAPQVTLRHGSDCPRGFVRPRVP